MGTISEAFSASINLAHICLYQERFSDAIHLYYTALKSNKSDVELLQYLALAQFKSKLFEDSMISLQRALFIQPTSPVLIYNLSYLRQEFALSILNKKLKSVKEIRIALDELNAAKKAFGSLKHVMATSVDKTRACLKPDLIPALEAFCAVDYADVSVY